jgi:hypothetical protein
MLASSVVTEITRLNEDWTRVQVLDVLNNVVQLLLKVEADANVYIDPTTGNLPWLATTAGTYRYDITPPSGVSFWKIQNIVTDLGNDPDFDVTINSWDREYQSLKFLARRYNVIPTRKYADYENTVTPGVPYVVFIGGDPGSQTQNYRYLAYMAPPQVLSETVTVPIADRYRYTVVVPAVQAMIDGLDNGRYADACTYVESLKPKLATDGEVDRIFSTNYSY